MNLNNPELQEHLAKQSQPIQQNFNRAIELAGNDAILREETIENLRLHKLGSLSTRALEASLWDLVNFQERYNQRVFGDFASRFRRRHRQNADPSQAEAELRTAEDILEGRTILGDNCSVEGLPENQSRSTPEYRVTGEDRESHLVEVKRIGEAGQPLSRTGLDRNLRAAIGQIRTQAEQTSEREGFVRIDGSHTGSTNITPENMRRLIKGRLVSQRGNQRVIDFVKWVEVLYNDDTGTACRLLFIFENGELTIYANED